MLTVLVTGGLRRRSDKLALLQLRVSKEGEASRFFVAAKVQRKRRCAIPYSCRAPNPC